jgi:hypothetical protein
LRWRTGVCVPFVLVMGTLLFADELLVHDFFELDHFGGVVCGETKGWIWAAARREGWVARCGVDAVRVRCDDELS